MAQKKLDGRRNLLSALSTLSELKENIPDRITGVLGRFNESGQKEVQVYKENGDPIPSYVWVRINGRPSEVIQAFNETALDTWNLPVILERDETRPRSYRVTGKLVSIFNDWQGYNNLGKHGESHSFSNTTVVGRDIVWIYRRQLVQPLLCHPNSSPDWTVYVEPDLYLNSNGEFVQWSGGYINLQSYQPSGTNAKFVTVYLDSATNTLGAADGVEFDYISPPVDKVPYIPEPPSPTAIPLAAVYIDSSTGSLTWDNVYDLRIFLLGNKGSVNTDGSGVATSVAYWSGPSSITGDDANFHWDITNKSLLIGRNVNDYDNTSGMKLLVQRDLGSTGGGMTTAEIMFSDSEAPEHVLGRSRGMSSTKSPLLDGDELGRLAWSGWTGAAWSTPPHLRAVASQNYASGVSGTVLEVWPTPDNTDTPVRAFGVDKLLTPGNAVVVDANGNLDSVPYDDLGGGGGGGGTTGLARFTGDIGDTQFYLPDQADEVYSVTIMGFELDPYLYSFDYDTSSVILNNQLEINDAIITIEYKITVIS